MISSAHKYISNYKCQCYRNENCNCAHKTDANRIFLENINDIAGTLAEVMMICGIHQVKAKASGQVVIYGFLHYNEVRHRIDTIPHKRFSRADVMFLLAQKCLMNRLEAQLAYSIMKRAFKAFYHGTGVGGIKNPILEAQLLHTTECFWVHAAKRTAQIFASYEGLFLSAQKYYESKILCVYKDLYERLKARTDPLVLKECECADCVKRIINKVPSPKEPVSKKEDLEIEQRPSSDKPRNSCPQARDSMEEDLEGKRRSSAMKGKSDGERKVSRVEFESPQESKMSLNMPHCYNCNCPKLICECDVHVDTGVLSAECSQGPYVCRWVRDDGEEKLDPCILIPENHQCPVDCHELSYECDPECECTCDECECPSDEDSSSIYVDFDYTDQMDRILEEVEEEETEPEFIPRAIDMTPMELRRPHPAFDCCRVARPPSKKRQSENEDTEISIEKTGSPRSSARRSISKRGSTRSSVNKLTSPRTSKKSAALQILTTTPQQASKTIDRPSENTGKNYSLKSAKSLKSLKPDPENMGARKTSLTTDPAEAENVKAIVEGLF